MALNGRISSSPLCIIVVKLLYKKDHWIKIIIIFAPSNNYKSIFIMKAICFCRVSTNLQDLTAQRIAVMEAIRKDGFLDDDIIVVEGKESAIKRGELERFTLNELKGVVEANPDAKDVYFFAIDRLARKVSVVLSVVDQMIERGVNLHFLNPYSMQTLRDGKEDAMGKMFLTFLSIGAEMEMKMKNERFASARATMRANGQLLNGKVYFGYYRDKNGYPQVKEDEAEIVRRIIRDYATTDKTLFAIARELVAEGKWKPATRNVLTMKASHIVRYTLYSEGKGAYVPIVDKELQQKAMAKLKTTKDRKKTETKIKYLAKGICFYADGTRLYPMCPLPRNHSYRVTIGDYTVKGEKNCLNVSIDIIDMIALDAAKRLHTVWLRDERWREPLKLDEEIGTVGAQKEQLEAKVSSLREDRSKAIKRAITRQLNDDDLDAIAHTFDEQISIVQTELTRCQSALERLQQRRAAYDDEHMYHEDYDKYSDDEKIALVKAMVQQIICVRTGDYEWTIHYQPLALNIGVALGVYRYRFAGGKKKVWRRLGGKEEPMAIPAIGWRHKKELQKNNAATV